VGQHLKINKSMLERIIEAKRKNDMEIKKLAEEKIEKDEDGIETPPFIDQENTSINQVRNSEIKIKESRNLRDILNSSSLPTNLFHSSLSHLKSDINMSSFKVNKAPQKSKIGSMLKKGLYKPYLTNSRKQERSYSTSPIDKFRNTANSTPIKKFIPPAKKAFKPRVVQRPKVQSKRRWINK
jgi:hypothetical protein